MSTPALRVAIYARQSVHEDEGVEQQLEACRSYVSAQKGWEIAREYPDNATSATKERGPGTRWAELLADIAAKRVDVVVAVAVDRLMRSIVDVMPLRAVRIVIVRDPIDTGGPMGRAMLQMMVTFAELEIANKEARRGPYMQARHAKGHPAPGEPPYGYAWISAKDRDSEERRWRISESEAEAVRWAFGRALGRIDPDPRPDDSARQTAYRERNRPPYLAEICEEMNARDWRTRSGTVWRPATLRRMLVNPVYAALLQPRREARPTLQTATGGERRGAETFDPDDGTDGLWDPLVTIDDVRAMRRALLDPRRTSNGGSVARRWPLSGLATCSTCDETVRSGVDRQGKRVYRCRAGHFTRSAPLLDEYVRAHAIWRLSQPDVHRLVQPADGADLDALDRERLDLVAKRGRLVEAVESGALPLAVVAARMADLSTRLAAVDAEYERAVEPSPLADLLGADDVAARWDALTPAAQHAALRALLTVQLRPVGKGRRARTFDDLEANVVVRMLGSDPVEDAARREFDAAHAAWLAGHFDSLDEALEEFGAVTVFSLPKPTPDVLRGIPSLLGRLGDDAERAIGAALHSSRGARDGEDEP